MDMSYIPTEYVLKKTVLRSEQWQRGHTWGLYMWTAILLWGFSRSENRFQFSIFGAWRSQALSLYWKWFQNKAGSKQELQRNNLQLNFKRFMNAFLKLTALSSRGKLWCSNPHHWRQSQIHNPGLNSYSGLVLGNLLLLLSTVQWAAPSGESISCQVTTAPTIYDYQADHRKRQWHRLALTTTITMSTTTTTTLVF